MSMDLAIAIIGLLLSALLTNVSIQQLGIRKRLDEMHKKNNELTPIIAQYTHRTAKLEEDAETFKASVDHRMEALDARMRAVEKRGR